MISRRNIIKAGKKKIILVDHNEKSQAVFDVEDADILEIIDHHRLGCISDYNTCIFQEPAAWLYSDYYISDVWRT